MKKMVDTQEAPASSAYGDTEAPPWQRGHYPLWRALRSQYRDLESRGAAGSYRAILTALLLVAAFVIIRGAWICDDAMIVFRVIDNWIEGYGLRWNAAERVQTYTCPLWMFLLTPFYALTRESYFTVIFVSLAVACVALWLTATRVLGGTIWSVAFMIIFVFAKTLVDFSTSGLEVPLTVLVLVGFLLAVIRGSRTDPATDQRVLVYAFGAASFAMLTRLDNALFVAPALSYLFFRGPFTLRRIRAAALGVSPLLLWELFSLFYYGTPLPNTAYAKLSTGIPSFTYLEQGLYYVRNLFEEDSLTGFAILIGAGIGLASFRTSKVVFWMAVGITLHVIYVIRVGGDHMSGRFLAPDAFLGLTLLFLSKLPSTGTRTGLAGLLLLLGFTGEAPPLFTEGDYFNRDMDAAGIVDERAYFNNELAFQKQARRHQLDDTPWAKKGLETRMLGKQTIVEGMVGCFSLFAGPDVHVIDPLGLTDPLLSRLPSHPRHWRVGHYRRQVPPGYRDSVQGRNQVVDPFLKSYYDKIRLITRGKLFDPKRLAAIWEINTGKYDHLLDSYLRTVDRSFPYAKSSLFKRRSGAPWDDIKYLTLSHTGLVIKAPPPVTDPAKRAERSRFEMSLRGGHSYRIEFWKKHRRTGEMELDLRPRGSDEMVARRMRIPAKTQREGYDRVFVATDSETTLAGLGHLRFSPFLDRVNVDEVVPKTLPPGTTTEPTPRYWFSGKGLLVELDTPRYMPSIKMEISGDDSFYYEVRKQGRTVYAGTSLKTQESTVAAARTISIPPRIAQKGYDALLLDPVAGKAPSAVKHIFLESSSAGKTATLSPVTETP